MTCARAGVPVERMNITLVPGVNMVVLSGSISDKVIESVLPKYRGQVAVLHNTLTLKPTR